ncbi:hypothetical protein [Bradyrhizobium liaoningense]|uniref:hypothetical protein n=1 Tax=Bradyrhizobium liaoningense TaxID=43992 RepID=UPI001BAB6905|nr:hypothetical protein [Bradyrhizobium liaoningense]MBR0902636.1 hypothetical protein [Bradyrhizobium liaoningense]
MNEPAAQQRRIKNGSKDLMQIAIISAGEMSELGMRAGMAATVIRSTAASRPIARREELADDG